MISLVTSKDRSINPEVFIAQKVYKETGVKLIAYPELLKDTCVSNGYAIESIHGALFLCWNEDSEEDASFPSEGVVYISDVNISPNKSYELVCRILKELPANGHVYIYTHLLELWYAFRVAIKERLLKPKKFELLFFPSKIEFQRITVDTRGRVNSVPKGCFDTFRILQSKLL